MYAGDLVYCNLFMHEHAQNEYIADCDKRREFITGFTGSAGIISDILARACAPYSTLLSTPIYCTRDCCGNNERGVALDGWSLPFTSLSRD